MHSLASGCSSKLHPICQVIRLNNIGIACTAIPILQAFKLMTGILEKGNRLMHGNQSSHQQCESKALCSQHALLNDAERPARSLGKATLLGGQQNTAVIPAHESRL